MEQTNLGFIAIMKYKCNMERSIIGRFHAKCFKQSIFDKTSIKRNQEALLNDEFEPRQLACIL